RPSPTGQKRRENGRKTVLPRFPAALRKSRPCKSARREGVSETSQTSETSRPRPNSSLANLRSYDWPKTRWTGHSIGPVSGRGRAYRFPQPPAAGLPPARAVRPAGLVRLTGPVVPPERRPPLHRIEQRPVALLHLMALREGRAGLVPERPQDAVVAVIGGKDR